MRVLFIVPRPELLEPGFEKLKEISAQSPGTSIDMDMTASYLGSTLKTKRKARELGMPIKFYCRIDRAAWLEEYKDGVILDGNLDYFSV